MDNVGIFNGHLEYFTAIWYSSPTGIFCGHLVSVLRVLACVYPEKNPAMPVTTSGITISTIYIVAQPS
jgi:hypothetical protein